ncbi:MAG TPA: FoF1 ATP synthase subunit gamma [Nitrospira sp.]|nr:FoF1 ATP synthase subunit gamma [Nitrospira sp.]
MSKRHEIDDHIRTLGEISEIMSAMNNLAMMEIHKLTRLLSAQQRVVVSMETAARDFLAFHPEALPRDRGGTPLYLVIGSERGFCGDYNGRLLSELERHLHTAGEKEPLMVVVGRKLSGRMAGDPRLVAAIDGPTVSEEIPRVLVEIIQRIHDLRQERQDSRTFVMTAVYRVAGTDGITIQPLRPFETIPRVETGGSTAPLLTLPPRVFIAELVDLYLFAILHEIFYSALMAESRERLTHLDGALKRLEKETSELRLRRNILRQEEITEEIELIMLSAEQLKSQ